VPGNWQKKQYLATALRSSTERGIAPGFLAAPKPLGRIVEGLFVLAKYVSNTHFKT
jgi:hypothetical protein